MKAIPIQSVKGGCGKTTVAINLALELAANGDAIGMADGDVDSPNLPVMLSLRGTLEQDVDKKFLPMTYADDRAQLKVVSTGLFGDDLAVFSKTGAENEQIVKDMIRNTEWGDLRYMLVDLPAGSGDELRGVLAALNTSILGVILVTLPVTIDDLFRATMLCARHEVKVLGVIENMTGALCSCGVEVICKKCKNKFLPLNNNGVATVEDTCEKIGVRYLGGIPLISGYFPQFGAGSPWLPDSARGPIAEAAKIIREES